VVGLQFGEQISANSGTAAAGQQPIVRLYDRVTLTFDLLVLKA